MIFQDALFSLCPYSSFSQGCIRSVGGMKTWIFRLHLIRYFSRWRVDTLFWTNILIQINIEFECKKFSFVNVAFYSIDMRNKYELRNIIYEGSIAVINMNSPTYYMMDHWIGYRARNQNIRVRFPAGPLGSYGIPSFFSTIKLLKKISRWTAVASKSAILNCSAGKKWNVNPRWKFP